MAKIWCEDYDDGTYTDATIKDIRRFRGVPLSLGRPLAGRFPEGTELVIRSAGKPLDFFKSGSMPVVSEHLKGVLDRFAVEAEFFDIELVRRGRRLDSRWYCMNPVVIVECMDLENSTYVRDGDYYVTDIDRLRLTGQADGRHPLFRVARTIPSLIAVRDDLAVAVAAAGCTGITFKAPADWRNPMYPV